MLATGLAAGAGVGTAALLAVALRGFALAPLAPLSSRLDAHGLLEQPARHRRDERHLRARQPGPHGRAAGVR